MANKTIYVADDDLPLYEQAQALADGNLSGAIARALRIFVQSETAHREGFEEVVVRVGPPGSQRKKRFYGYRITEWRHPHGDSGMGMEIFSVYRTRKGHYAVHRVEMPSWLPGPMQRLFDDAWLGGLASRAWKGVPFEQWFPAGTAKLDVYQTLDEMESQVPPDLVARLRDHGDEPPMEDLDI